MSIQCGVDADIDSNSKLSCQGVVFVHVVCVFWRSVANNTLAWFEINAFSCNFFQSFWSMIFVGHPTFCCHCSLCCRSMCKLAHTPNSGWPQQLQKSLPVPLVLPFLWSLQLTLFCLYHTDVPFSCSFEWISFSHCTVTITVVFSFCLCCSSDSRNIFRCCIIFFFVVVVSFAFALAILYFFVAWFPLTECRGNV